MDSKGQRPTSQMNLLLRIIAGCYLVYLAFDMRKNFAQSPAYIVAAVVFALAGVALAVLSFRRMKRGEFDYLDSKGNVIVPDDLPEEEPDFPAENELEDE